jgi:hypothetical protein
MVDRFRLAAWALLLLTGSCVQPKNSADPPGGPTPGSNRDGNAAAGNPGTGGQSGSGGGQSGSGGGGQSGTGGNGQAPVVGTGGTGSDPNAPCVAGATRCAATGAVVEVCTPTGWTMQKTCPSVCQDGACSGKCMPGDKQCAPGQKPQTCGMDGEWLPPEDACPLACVGKGDCGGECVPGTLKCGAGPDVLMPFTCDEQGKWLAKPPACANLCSSGSCAGSCMPRKTQCLGNTPQTCSDQGTWESQAPCKGQTCVDGACVGECAPTDKQCSSSGNNRQTCDKNGRFQDAGACANQTCSKGACVGACQPDAPRRCSPDQKATQTCGAGGVWTNADSCGDNGCNGGVCNMCKPGSKRCSGDSLQTCSSDGSSWGQDQRCQVRCDGAKLVCVDMIACSPACNGSPHCASGNGSIVTERCDTSTGRCVVASTVSTCTGGSSCKGNKCLFDCKCSTARRCKDDQTAVVDDKCDPNVGKCEERVVETCGSNMKDICDKGQCKINHDEPCPLNQVGSAGDCVSGTKCQAVSGTCESAPRENPDTNCTQATFGSTCFAGDDHCNEATHHCVSGTGTMSCMPDLNGKSTTPSGCGTNCKPSGSLCNPQR